jgi:hypothetical protein
LAVADTYAGASAPPGSPLALLQSMEAEMGARRCLVDLYEAYHEGRHQLGFMTSKFRATFGHMLAAVNDNWMPLVLRARIERLGVQGLQFEDDREGSELAWDVWRRNFLDEDSPMLFTESAKHGEAYTLTWYDHRPKVGVFGRFFSRGTRQVEAEITVEHPAQFIVRRSDGQRREFEAALKLWPDDDGETRFAYLFTPDRLYRYIDRGKGWQPWEAKGAPAEERNPLLEVPATAYTYDPHMLPCYPPSPMLCAPHNIPMVHIGLGRSVLPDVIPTQDQINLLLCHFMINSEFRSFAQRWATGLEVGSDSEGNPRDPGYKAVVDRLWVATGAEAKFGSFVQDDPTPILDGINGRIMSLAARTRTPSHYLPRPSGNYPSGETLKAAETGLISTVNESKIWFSGSIRNQMRLAFTVMGDRKRAGQLIEPNWRNSESRSESEFVDSLVKKLSIGVPMEQLWIDYGYSPSQIENFKAMALESALRGAILPVPELGNGAPPKTAPVQPNEVPPAQA